MTRITVGNGVYIISEIRKEKPLAPVAHRRKGVFIFVFVLVALGLFNVWLSGQCVRTGYRISSALEEMHTLQEQKDVLGTEVLTLRSPSRIETIARTQLGMVDPLMEGVIR
ncbi:MAG: cell division protein FtsL [Syntrophorhabdaceae bacterium]|nr:cell division protein FtsL [Syntrophorhabdaceae bacterium]